METNQEKSVRNILGSRSNVEIKVIPSYHCEMNCSYCYNKYLYNGYRPNYSKLINVVSEIILNNNFNVIIEIIGGEPLSSRNYPKTMKIIEYLPSLKKDVKLVLQTGSRDIKKLLTVIPRVDGLSYSVDLSLLPKAANIKNLEIIARQCEKYNTKLQIQTALTQGDDIESICRFIDLCVSYGVGWLGLGYPVYQRYTRKEMNAQIDIYCKTIKHSRNRPEITIGGAIIESAIDFLNGQTYSSCCMCGENSVTIQPDGSLSPSLYFEPSAFKSVDAFVKVKYRREEQLRKDHCLNCEIWDVCHGGCMGHTKFLTGDIYSYDKEFCYVLCGLIEKLKSVRTKSQAKQENLSL